MAAGTGAAADMQGNLGNSDGMSGDQPIEIPIGGGNRAIAENASVLKGLLDSMADPIFVKDEHHRYIFGNTAYWALLGQDAEEKYLYKDDRALFPPDEIAIFWEIDDRIIRGGDVIENEETISVPGSKTVIARTKKSPFTLPNGRPGLVGVIRDISKEKNAEAAASIYQEEAKRKSEFLAAMSHELRTPLNGILGMAQAIASHDIAKPVAEMTEIIHRSGAHLLEMITNVLEISQGDTQKLALSPGWFELDQLIGPSVALVQGRAEDKGLSLNVDIEPGTAGHYWGDVARLRQILVNLLSNAVKYSDRGAITLHFEQVDAGPDQTELMIKVTDTGRGIAEVDLETVFEPFQRGTLATGFGEDGAGLGLAIVDRLVRRMNGAITAKSGVGSGTTFCIHLPTKFKTTSELPDKSASKTGPRLLCAEDQEINRKVLKALLAPLGGIIQFAEDGQQAINQFEAGTFDAVLMDVRMPVLSGLEATKAIRALEQERGLMPVPIIAVTANAFAEQVDECMASGMDFYVSKPIDAATLLQTVRDAIQNAENNSSTARQAAG